MKVSKIGKSFEFKPENWKERFTVRISGLLFQTKLEGEPIPYFYLPVYRRADMIAVECWIFPLAPIVLLLRILENMFISLWHDLLRFQLLLIAKRKRV